MQLPEKVDFNWQSVLQKALIENVINIHEIVSENGEISAELKNANAAYEYWDKARYTILPGNISAELFWSILKFRRSGLYAEKVRLGTNFFKYLINPEILKKLAFIERFDLKTALSLDEENEYSANAKMEEAIASSRLEGADVSREAAKEMLRANIAAENESERMVTDNYRALNFIEKNTDKEFSIDLIKQLHDIIVNSAKGGSVKGGSVKDCSVEDGSVNDGFRKDSQGVRVVDIRDDEVLYEPPKAEDIETLMNALCEYANSQTETNDIVKAIIIHFLFAYIHPFKDGNGRIARILFYFYVLKSDFNSFKYLSISKILRVIPSQYAKVFLYTEIDENDLTYFINFNLDVLLEAITNFKTFLDDEKDSSPAAVLINGDVKLNLRHQSILNEFAGKRNSRNIEYFKNKLGVVYETARKDMMYLEKKGFLKKTKKSKEFIYSLSKKSLKKLEEAKTE